MKIALIQQNYTVGDLKKNALKLQNCITESSASEVDLWITSELAITGYPPKDLLLNPDFSKQALLELEVLAKTLDGCAPALVGCVDINVSFEGKPLYNSAFLLHEGKIQQRFHKTLLPCYDVFEETRYFHPAEHPQILSIKGKRFGVTLCEDIWNHVACEQSQAYANDPLPKLAAQNIDGIINLSASPFSIGKSQKRQEMLSALAQKYECPLIYVNQVGANDELIFDGNSCVFEADGHLLYQAKSFEEELCTVDLNSRNSHPKPIPTHQEALEEIWNALVMGVRDYVSKSGFSTVLLGLSGGIDSALTAAIAVESLGASQVLGVMMPSPYSSTGSIEDSQELAELLGISTQHIPIAPMMEAFSKQLEASFTGYPEDTTEENLQARIRGSLLMALSNKYGSLLLTTGNKSELAVGYCTLYGDMSGALGVISDLYKTKVYALSHWINKHKGNTIPQSILDKPPSAELRPGQTDQDSLPDYETLDRILALHIEQHLSASQIIKQGFEASMVHDIIRLFKNSEFKRYQAAMGLKLTEQTLGVGWKVPLVYQNS